MRRARRNSLLALSALTAVAAQPARPNKEDVTRQQLEQAEQTRAAEQAAQQAAAARAATAATEAQRLTEQRVAAAAKLRDAETATAAAAERMEGLAAARRKAQAGLAARAETMQPLLPVIERLSLFPAETLLAVPAEPEETLRGILVLKGLARQIGIDAKALHAQQVRLAAATQAVAAEAPVLAAAEAKQQAEAAALDQQIATAQASQELAAGDAAVAAQRAADAASRADTLRGIAVELERQQRDDAMRMKAAGRAAKTKAPDAPIVAPANVASMAEPHGLLTAPVAGNVVRAWGDATAGGPSHGISYRAAPNARVVSPCAGRVAFAAPFRSYGLLLIVECGGGYHTVLAGFERLDAKVGQDVAAGEPVGVMPGWDPGAQGDRPSLYVELWRGGQPVNPAPWLKASS